MIFSNISQLCKKKKIPISKLEKDCGLGNGTISGWKTSSPTVDNLKKVADALGVKMDDLLDGEVAGEGR